MNPTTTEKPKFILVEPIEMALIICGPDVIRGMPCEVQLAFYDGTNVFVIKGVDYSRNRQLASYIVHHIVHHNQMQLLQGKLPKAEKDKQKLEKEALRLQEIYAKSVGI